MKSLKRIGSLFSEASVALIFFFLQYKNTMCLKKANFIYKHRCKNLKVIVVAVQSLCGVQLFATLWAIAHSSQCGRLPCPSLSPRVCSNSRPLSWWHYITISFSATAFSFCLQSFPASGSFPMSQLFASGGQSIGASASATVIPMNIKGWFLLGLTGLISLLPEGLSRDLLQHCNSKASIIHLSAFFMITHQYRTPGKP